MYLETRKQGKRVKYYLANSYRKAGKVMKTRVYLGEGLSGEELTRKRAGAEKKLLQRMRDKEKIGDPYAAALSPTELGELKTLEAKGEIRVPHLTEDDWRLFTEKFTYDTNAIEGSKIGEAGVTGVLEKGEWPEGDSKQDIAETYGVAEAVAFIRKTDERLSLNLVKKLHKIVFKNSKRFAGEFRSKGVEVVVADRFGNVVHRGAPSEQVGPLLKKLAAWYAKNAKHYPPLVLAAVVHNQFENIHPFEDGNGRVGRLLLNYVLLKHGLPPVNIELRNRQEYYAALQAYEKESDLKPTITLMLKEYKALKKLLKR